MIKQGRIGEVMDSIQPRTTFSICKDRDLSYREQDSKLSDSSHAEIYKEFNN